MIGHFYSSPVLFLQSGVLFIHYSTVVPAAFTKHSIVFTGSLAFKTSFTWIIQKKGRRIRGEKRQRTDSDSNSVDSVICVPVFHHPQHNPAVRGAVLFGPINEQRTMGWMLVQNSAASQRATRCGQRIFQFSFLYFGQQNFQRWFQVYDKNSLRSFE